MTHAHSAAASRAALCVVLLAALVMGIVPQRAVAAPDQRPIARADSPRERVSARLGPAVVSLTSTATAIPTAGDFSYQADIRSRSEIGYALVRMRLLSPETGRLIYQKTFIAHRLEAGTASFTYHRTIADIGLEPGSYPVEVTVSLSAGGSTHDTVLHHRLVVFDPKQPALPVTVIVRVSAVPLADPDGAFVLDPAMFTRARSDVTRLAEYVLENESSRLTLALSPVMLEEWRRIAGGYRFEGPEGPVEVPEGEAIPRAYALALDKLRAAVMSGRLELLSTGYSDPDLSELAAAGLSADIRPQYDIGISACYAAIETTPTTGTAPAGGGMSEAAGSLLYKHGLRYVVARNRRAVVGKSAAAPGVYRATASSLRVLAADDEAARTLAASSTAAVVGLAFDRYLRDSSSPLPISVTVGPDATSASRVIEFVERMSTRPWARPVLAREAAGRPAKKRVRLIGAPADERSPARHWESVARSRSLVTALLEAVGRRDDTALAAQRDSLTAEGSAWAGTRGTWVHAARSAAYAADAENAAKEVLDAVSVGARPVTLASSRGEVPITITNRSDRELRVRLVVRPSDGVVLGVRSTRTITLQPQENYIEIPIDLRGGLTGTLDVRVTAGGVSLADTLIEVRASFIDRLAIIAGIVVVLGALLAFIIARVRAAEAEQPSGDRGVAREK